MANAMSPFSMAGMLAFGTSLSSRAAGRSVLVDALVSMSVFLGYELWNWVSPRIQTGIYREIHTTLHVCETDMAWSWLDHYLSLETRDRIDRSPTLWTRIADWFWDSGQRAPHELRVKTDEMVQANRGWDASKLDYRAQYVMQYVRFRGRTIGVRYVQPGNIWNDDRWYTLTVTFGSYPLLREFLQYTHQLYIEKDLGQLPIYHPSSSPRWKYMTTKPPRPWESVILPRGMKEDLLADASEFLAEEEYYKARGLPWRRGWLLYGKPGSGKSSLIAALASKLDLALYSVSLVSPWLDDASLMALMCELPTKSVLLMEDIDCALREGDTESDDEKSKDGKDDEKDKKDTAKKKKSKTTEKQSKVTLSGLLNALDGVAAAEGRLLFATTNYISRIDPALSRPGRCDVWLEFGNATRDQARELFLHMYSAPGPREDAHQEKQPPDRLCSSKDELSEKTSLLPPGAPLTPPATPKPRRQSTDAEADLPSMAEQFARGIPPDKVSTSAIQGYLMRHKRDPVGAVEQVGAWVAAGFPQAMRNAKGIEVEE